MVHQCQCLALSRKPGDYILGIHARFDDFQSDLLPDRLFSFGNKDDTHSALPDFFAEFIRTDGVSGSLGDCGTVGVHRWIFVGSVVQEIVRIFVCGNETLNFPPQLGVVAARLSQKRLALVAVVPDGLVEQGFDVHDSPRATRLPVSRITDATTHTETLPKIVRNHPRLYLTVFSTISVKRLFCVADCR